MVKKLTGGLETHHRSLSVERVIYADKIQDGDCRISAKFDSPGRLDVLRRSQICVLVFLDYNPSGVLTVSSLQSRKPCVSVLGFVL